MTEPPRRRRTEELGFVAVQRGRRATADTWLARAQALAATDEEFAAILGIAFLPWPQALRAEPDLYAGDLEAAADGFEQAWVMGCQLNDPCWEGMAARGLGLLNAGRGDLRELVVRAELHQVRLGDPTALASARLLSANIDNPALTRLLS